MDCLHCGKKINVLRKLQNEEFCSAAHRKAYNQKQEDLAVDFLRQSKPRPLGKRELLPEPPPEPPRAKPLNPALAEFMAEGVTQGATPQLAAALLPANAEPVDPQWRARLPAQAGVTAPGLCSPGFRLVVLPGDVVPGGALPAQAAPVAFAGERPRLRSGAPGPLWMEPPGPGEPPAAGFIAYRPAEAKLESRLAGFSPSPKSPRRPPRISQNLPASRPAFQVARAHPSPAIARRPVSGPQASADWRFRVQVLSVPCAAIAASASVLPASALPGLIPSYAGPAPTAPACIVRVPAAPRPLPTIPSLNLARDAPLLRSAPGAALPLCPIALSAALVNPPSITAREFQKCFIEIPLPSRETRAASLRPAPQAATEAPSALLAGALKATPPATLTWKFAIGPSPHARVGAIGPAFDEDLRHLPIPRAPRRPGPLRRLATLATAVPRSIRRLAAMLALVVFGLAFAGRIGRSLWLQGARRDIMAHIVERSEIDIQDDFRSGLSQWTGAPGWANTWSYDRAGFARPGRLALLAGSVPLADYRLEFIAQIDKKAVAWVFRASDARNYYAMKLVESRAGVAAVYGLVRYAVIGGHERFRIQLPLPFDATAKTMFRVRQEIRGAEFTTSLDGHIVDTWSDASLARGGVGFFSDPGETAYVRWVDVARNDDALGRVCAYLTSGKHH